MNRRSLIKMLAASPLGFLVPKGTKPTDCVTFDDIACIDIPKHHSGTEPVMFHWMGNGQYCLNVADCTVEVWRIEFEKGKNPQWVLKDKQTI